MIRRYIIEGDEPVEAQRGDTPSHVLVPVGLLESAEAVCTQLAAYRAATADWQRQGELWDTMWTHHQVWAAHRAAAARPNQNSLPTINQKEQ